MVDEVVNNPQVEATDGASTESVADTTESSEAVGSEDGPGRSESDDDEAAASDLPAVTRADCTWLGLKIYGLGLMIPLALCVVLECIENLYAMATRSAPWEFNVDFGQLFLAIYLGVLPLAFFGMVMGFETFRVVVGSRKPFRLHGAGWIVLCILGLPYGVTFWAVIPLYLQSRLRKVALHGESELQAFRSVLHIIYMIVWFIAFLVGTAELRTSLRPGNDVASLSLPLIICAWSAVWVCDFLLLMTFSAWRSVRILAKPPSHTMQYSLGFMLGVVLAIGSWVSGLMHIFGR